MSITETWMSRKQTNKDELVSWEAAKSRQRLPRLSTVLVTSHTLLIYFEQGGTQCRTMSLGGALDPSHLSSATTI